MFGRVVFFGHGEFSHIRCRKVASENAQKTTPESRTCRRKIVLQLFGTLLGLIRTQQRHVLVFVGSVGCRLGLLATVWLLERDITRCVASSLRLRCLKGLLAKGKISTTHR
jgi:hypothetical protein